MDRELDNAKKLSGELKKKSPSLIKGYQKRYFMILNDKLVYFKNQSQTSDVKGSLMLVEISTVEKIGQKEFEINYSGRKFELRADSSEERDHWVRSLLILVNFFKKQGTEIAKNMSQSRARGVTTNKEGDHWRSIDEDSKKEIVLAREKKIFEQNENIRKATNDGICEKKNIKPHLKFIPKEVLDKRTIMGFLNKRGKEANSSFQKRWFILISGKPLKENVSDEAILDENQLPPWMELETIYYFKYDYDEDKSERKGDIPLKSCLEVTLEEGSPEKGYQFKVNLGDRIYVMNAQTTIERDEWVEAIRSSMRTYKELRSTGPSKSSETVVVKKNVDKIIDIFDDRQVSDKNLRNQNLKKYMDESIKKIIEDTIKKLTMDNLETLTKALNGLKTELLDVITGLKAKSPKRIDIVKEYLVYFHEKICTELSNFWDENRFEIDNFTTLNLASWIECYNRELSPHCIDERLMVGIKTLLNIYISRNIDNIEPMIEGINELEIKNPPQANENGILVTSAPYDLFKLINEAFDIALKIYNKPEIGANLAFFGRCLIITYQDYLDDGINDDLYDSDHLIAICNNTISYCNLTKEFTARLDEDLKLTDEDQEKFFDSKTLLKQFVSLGNNAKDKLLNFLFLNIDSFFKCYFLDLQLQEIVEEMVENYKKTFVLLHDSYYKKVWKSFLDRVIISYFQVLIFSCVKSKKGHQQSYILKIDADKRMLFEQFEDLIFVKYLEKSLLPFETMIKFIKSPLFFCNIIYCISLKQDFGPAFTSKQVKMLYCIKYDMNSDLKKQLIREIEKIFEAQESVGAPTTKKIRRDSSDKRKYQLFEDMMNQSVPEELKIDESKLLREYDDGTSDKGRRTSFNLSMDDPKVLTKRSSIALKLEDLDVTALGSSMVMSRERLGSEAEVRKKSLHEVSRVFSGEGYLYKKPPKSYKKIWEKRYFRLRNNVLYWYKNHQSNEAKNKINLVEAQSCFGHKTKVKNFKIKVSDKFYKFAAENQEDRDEWVEAIKKIMNKDHEKPQGSTDQDDCLYISQKERKMLFNDFEGNERRQKAIDKLDRKEKKEQSRIDAMQRALESKEIKLNPLVIKSI